MQDIGNISGIPASNLTDNLQDGQFVAVNGKNKAISTAEANKGWILNPLLDILFVCGGMVWLLYAWTFTGASGIGQDANSQAYAFILFWGSFLITDAHTPATLVRVFGSPSTPKRVRYLVGAWGVALLVLGAFSVTNKELAQAFVKITLLWGIQHYIAQTFGVVLIYCFKRNYKLDALERFVFQGLMRSLMVFVWTRMLTMPDYGHIQNFMGMEIPFWSLVPPWVVPITQAVFGLFVIAFFSLVVGRAIVKKQFFPLPGILSVVSLAAIVMSPRNGFYLLGVCFYHASQYLAITFSYYLKEKSLLTWGELPTNVLPHFMTRRALAYFAGLIGLGYLCSFVFPLSLSRAGLPEALSLCTVYAILNCHHFLSDALIWRIRDPKVRSLLV